MNTPYQLKHPELAATDGTRILTKSGTGSANPATRIILSSVYVSPNPPGSDSNDRASFMTRRIESMAAAQQKLRSAARSRAAGNA